MLLSLYCALVALELGIKDHFAGAGWPSGHRIADWVSELGQAALSVQLRNQLSALQCTDRDGVAASVEANSYPELRYIRHESDFVGTTTDVQIEAALQVVKDIKTALAATGVAL